MGFGYREGADSSQSIHGLSPASLSDLGLSNVWGWGNLLLFHFWSGHLSLYAGGKVRQLDSYGSMTKLDRWDH